VRTTSRTSSSNSHMVVPDLRQWSVDDLATKKELLLAGLGWGRLPEHIIVDELSAGRLVPIHVPSVAMSASYDTVLARRRDRPVGPIGMRIWQEFANRVPADASEHPAVSSSTDTSSHALPR
ncbi:MAG: LysR substrate-binding domain-containing protein, partial [Myxococcota bacterium]